MEESGAGTSRPVVAALTYSIGKQAPYLFTMTPEAICRSVYGLNPFPEAIPAADYIRDHTDVSDRIVVLAPSPRSISTRSAGLSLRTFMSTRWWKPSRSPG